MNRTLAQRQRLRTAAFYGVRSPPQQYHSFGVGIGCDGIYSSGNTLGQLIGPIQGYSNRILTHEEMWEAHIMRENRKFVCSDRARQLLIDMLPEPQRASYELAQSFIVTAASSTRYRINHGAVANIDVLDGDDKVVHRLCMHPQDVPIEDVMLAQYLLLVNDEQAFLKEANIHRLMAA